MDIKRREVRSLNNILFKTKLIFVYFYFMFIGIIFAVNMNGSIDIIGALQGQMLSGINHALIFIGLLLIYYIIDSIIETPIFFVRFKNRWNAIFKKIILETTSIFIALISLLLPMFLLHFKEVLPYSLVIIHFMIHLVVYNLILYRIITIIDRYIYNRLYSLIIVYIMLLVTTYGMDYLTISFNLPDWYYALYILPLLGVDAYTITTFMMVLLVVLILIEGQISIIKMDSRQGHSIIQIIIFSMILGFSKHILYFMSSDVVDLKLIVGDVSIHDAYNTVIWLVGTYFLIGYITSYYYQALENRNIRYKTRKQQYLTIIFNMVKDTMLYGMITMFIQSVIIMLMNNKESIIVLSPMVIYVIEVLIICMFIITVSLITNNYLYTIITTFTIMTLAYILNLPLSMPTIHWFDGGKCNYMIVALIGLISFISCFNIYLNKDFI